MNLTKKDTNGNTVPEYKNIAKLSALAIGTLIVLFNLPLVSVGAGQRGIVQKFGSVQTQALGEGLHFKTPIQDRITKVDVKTQTTKIEGVAGSSDSQIVTFTAQVNWNLNPKRVTKTFQETGDERDVESSYIVNKGPDAIKEAVSKSTAIDFQKNRESVRKIAVSNLRKRMGTVVEIQDISFVNIDFSSEFNAAIEAKVTAEQEAQAQKNKLESVKYQAQQKVETAKAEAESIRIQTEALSQNQNLIELEKAKRWDGKLPTTVVGGAVPFFDINK